MPFQSVEFTSPYCEYLGLKLKNNSGDLLLVSIYRSPNSENKNKEKLLDLLQQISEDRSKNKVVFGDFNLPGIDWESLTFNSGEGSLEYRFIEKVRDCFLTQHIHAITRSRGNERGNILDLVFTEDEGLVEEVKVLSPLGKSDHACILFNCLVNAPVTESKRVVYLYEKADYG